MRETMTATTLRSDLYRVLDRVLATGEAQRIVRKGRTLLILPEDDAPRLDLTRLPRRHATDLGAEELAAIRWDDAWSPEA